MTKEKMDLEVALMVLTALTNKNGGELLVTVEELDALQTLGNSALSIEMKDNGIELKIVEDKPEPVKSKIVIVK